MIRFPGKLIGLMLILSIVTLIPAFAARELQRSFDFHDGQTLTVNTERCNVTITGSRSSTLEVRAECDSDIEKYHKLNFHQTSGGVKITSHVDWEDDDHQGGFHFLGIHIGNNRHIEKLNLTISVPEKSEIRVENSRGEISISAIDGPVKLENSRSDSRIESVRGPVKIKSSRGSITVSGVRSGGEIFNNRADIHLANSSGDFKVENSRGNTNISNLRGQLAGSSNRGNMKVIFAGQPTGNCNLSSTRGDLEIGVSENSDTKITATVKRGKLYSERPMLYKNESGGVIDSKSNADAPILDLSAYRGNIRIKELDI